MSDTKAKYTPWTIPQSDWTPVLAGVEINDITREELTRAIQDFDKTELDKRLSSYNIKITNETMSKLIK